MAEESAQQPTGELQPAPAANRHASPKSATKVPEIQPPEKTPRLILVLANLFCLLVAGMYVWSTHDLIGFILLYGIATGAINARDVVGAMLPRRLSQDNELSDQDQ